MTNIAVILVAIAVIIGGFTDRDQSSRIKNLEEQIQQLKQPEETK